MALPRHGMTNTPTYLSWKSMKARCLRTGATSYWKYGGLGIKIHEPWLRFDNFVADMGIRPEGKTLDRKYPDGNYEPDNCRWITPAEQQRNRRTIKPTISGYQGVYPGYGGKWRAQIHIDNVQYELGSFEDKEDAVLIRLSAVEQLIN